MKTIAYHISNEMICGPRFAVEWKPGDDWWAASLHLEFTWRGRHYWHCWFLPWWPTEQRKERTSA